MKSEWEFHFEARDFQFAREHKYRLLDGGPVSIGGRPPEELEPFVRIVPKPDVDPPPGVEQEGSIFIELPYPPEETRDLAFELAGHVAERIAFGQGDLRVSYSPVMYRRIPETPEEEESVGDRTYGIEARFREYEEAPAFSSERLLAALSSPERGALISQFNETRSDASPIRQFLGYFRILESIYCTQEKIPLKRSLAENQELTAVYEGLGLPEPYEEFIARIVEGRHRCAHLKLAKGFGYVPDDPAVNQEVVPLLDTLEALAYLSIKGPG